MKRYLLVAVLLCGGCSLFQATVAVKQQADMGEKVSEEIFKKGAVAGSELAKKNYIINASLSDSLGKPETSLEPTLPNIEATAKTMADEKKSMGFWSNVLSVLGQVGQTALSGIPGGGWMLGLLGTVTTFLGVLRRNQIKIRDLSTATSALIGSTGEIIKEVRKGPISEEKVLKINKAVQGGFKIRDKMKSLIAGFEKSDTSKGIVAAAIANGGK